MRRRRAVTRPRAKRLPPSLGSGDFVAQPVRRTIFVQAHRDDANENHASAIASLPPLGRNESVTAIEREVTMDTSLESLCSGQMDGTSVETPLPSLGSRESVAGGGNDDHIEGLLPSFCSVQLDDMNAGHHIGETSLSSLGSSGQEDTSQDSPMRRAVGLPAKARKMPTW